MTLHRAHFAICGVALAIGIVLFAAGTAAALLPAIGCILMLVLMMSGKGWMHGREH